jgi:hypothetical protein
MAEPINRPLIIIHPAHFVKSLRESRGADVGAVIEVITIVTLYSHAATARSIAARKFG